MARVFITGSTDGLGHAAAQWLMREGHQVVLHARSHERAEQALDRGRQAVATVAGDLRSAAGVRAFADQVSAIGRMDAIIHNAGIYTAPERGSTPEGHATVLAVNTLAPYMLTALIERPDRLIYLSSGLHRGGEGSLRDIDWVERPWDAARAYAESKLHLAALAAALARRWPDVISSAVDPRWVRTKMGGQSAPVDIDTGQRMQSWLAVSNDPQARVSGGYWHNMRRQQPADEVIDYGFQDLLLARLAELTGLHLP
jgi:NAD(P)-dependent dehydrogenase (short-subunit alcohol dehydrogenase family)